MFVIISKQPAISQKPLPRSCPPCTLINCLNLKDREICFSTPQFFLVFHLVTPISHHQIVCWGKAQKQQQMSPGGLQNSPAKITLSIKEIISLKYHMPTSPQLQKSPALENCSKSSNHQLHWDSKQAPWCLSLGVRMVLLKKKKSGQGRNPVICPLRP